MFRSRFSYSNPDWLSTRDRLKRRVKQVLPTDFRRIRVYCVGLERTGTTHISSLFSKYRVWHEPDVSCLLPVHREEQMPSAAWLRSRDRALRLEVESSHLLGPIVGALAKTFPQSTFICTAREPVSWVRSVWRWTYPDMPGMRHNAERTEAHKSWAAMMHTNWHAMMNAYYGGHEHQSEILKECGLYSLKGYFSKYASHYRGILESVPSDRLLVVRTASLSERISQIAKFVDVKESTLTPPEKRVNRSTSKSAPFDAVEDALIKSQADKYCGHVWGQLLERSRS